LPPQQQPPGTAPLSGAPAPGGNGNPAGTSTSTATTSTTSAAITPSPQPSGQTPAELAAKATPRTAPGAIRWALLVVVIAGLVGASSRPLEKFIPVLWKMRR
jgi:hypothetical protein